MKKVEVENIDRDERIDNKSCNRIYKHIIEVLIKK